MIKIKFSPVNCLIFDRQSLTCYHFPVLFGWKNGNPVSMEMNLVDVKGEAKAQYSTS